MTPIGKFFDADHLSVPARPWFWPLHIGAQEAWRTWAREALAWLKEQAADPRDALVVLPVGAVLSQARQAWGAEVGDGGGWVPRIDTIASVAESLAWAWAPDDAADEAGLPPVTLDAVVDRLQASRSLGKEAWAKQWARRDRRGFEFALEQVVDAAHTWVRRMQSVAPADRAAFVDHARASLSAGGRQPQGPGGRERLLLAWALEWAQATAGGGLPVDVLYGMRPSALLVVTAGQAVSPGTEGHLTLGLMDHLARQGVPVCWHSAVAASLPQASTPRDKPPMLVSCRDAEDEAQQAAAQVIAAVNRARAAEAVHPVALIALDRGLIRRVRAMLEGAGILMADETGWLLSTTRAAAVLTRLLQASHPRASTDDLLDWLKSGWLAWSDETGTQGGRPAGKDREMLNKAAGQLEAWCRRHGMLGAWGLQLPAVSALPASNEDQSSMATENSGMAQLVPTGKQAMPPSAVRLWHWALQAVEPLQRLWTARKPSLQDWLLALHEALARSGALAVLKDDAAGELALDALRFDMLDALKPEGQAAGQGMWAGLSTQTRLDGPAFLRWVGEVLEATTFRPPAPEQAADVVITPMARAVLRPFDAIVLPGADERQLGAMGSQSGWLGVKLREAMDLATPTSQRAAQWDAFSLLMSRPGVVCLYRHAQGSEPLEPSAWLERWSAQERTPIAAQADARERRSVPRTPVPAPLPTLHDARWALPEQVSATSYDALRQCPYRFFAGSVLGLREQDELEEGLDRSDFGIWLHEVLRSFHAERQTQLALSTPEEDVRAWLDAAQAVIRQQGLDRDSQRPYFLPFRADLDRMAQAYVGWLRAHEDQGWTVRDTESAARRELRISDALQVTLQGQLDRVDMRRHDGRRQRLVIDYKTGSADTLKRKVGNPLEDTQLAFYAALSEPEPGAASGQQDHEEVAAAYLHLDVQAVRQFDHAEVAHSAQVLLDGLARDWARLHAGAPMPALGEGSACAFCQARGLCRKDHWDLAPHATDVTTAQGPQA